MNLRHAGALALVGWYLLTPPIRRPASGSLFIARDPMTQAPTDSLSSWDEEASFDSANECEHAKIVFWRALKDHPQSTGLEQKIREAAAQEARCVATDDPRLKEK
jgi:hypothetical protein